MSLATRNALAAFRNLRLVGIGSKLQEVQVHPRRWRMKENDVRYLISTKSLKQHTGTVGQKNQLEESTRFIEQNSVNNFFNPAGDYVRLIQSSSVPKTSLEEKKPILDKKKSDSDKNPNLDGKPTGEQMKRVYDSLEKSLPNIFKKQMDYSIYSPTMVLVDNIRNKTYQGLTKYFVQIVLLKVYAHIKFAFVYYDIISMHQVPNEGRITVRWRIKGISGLRVFLKFWQVKIWKWRELVSNKESWHDGISHYDVGVDGLVYKHTIDRVMEDTERVDNSRDRKLQMAAKLAGASAFSTPLSVILDAV